MLYWSVFCNVCSQRVSSKIARSIFLYTTQLWSHDAWVENFASYTIHPTYNLQFTTNSYFLFLQYHSLSPILKLSDPFLFRFYASLSGPPQSFGLTVKYQQCHEDRERGWLGGDRQEVQGADEGRAWRANQQGERGGHDRRRVRGSAEQYISRSSLNEQNDALGLSVQM